MNHATLAQFERLGARVGIDARRAAELWQALVALYSNEVRSYHNLNHIDRMLGWAEQCRDASDSEAIKLAIWYHDAIYEPTEKNNEEESAHYFATHLGGELGDSLAADVCRLILATDPTRERSGRIDEDLIIDIDLTILGSEAAEYDAYARAIRSEYSFVAEQDFIEGRGRVLRKFLSRQIYGTDFFVRLECQARENIARELAALRGVSD